MAVAAIQLSLTGARRPAERSPATRAAQASTTGSSTGSGSSASASRRVAIRRALAPRVVGVRTPRRSSATVTTETETLSGMVSLSNRSFSQPMRTLVSINAVVTATQSLLEIEVVSRLYQHLPQLVPQLRVGSADVAQLCEELASGHGRPPGGQRDETGNRPPVHRDRELSASFDAAKHLTDVVTQVTQGDLIPLHVPLDIRHEHNRSRCSTARMV